MIRVTVELLPYGVEKDKEVLEILEIANVGGSLGLGEYSIRQEDGSWGKNTFKHYRADGVLELVTMALQKQGYGNN